MRVHNAVVGMEVQVKRNCRGHFDEFIKKGLVCTVDRIDDSYMAEYELRLKHPDIEDGYAWVNASDVRRYVKPTESPLVVEPIVESDEVPDEPQDDIQVGDSVLVGAEGAGHGCVMKAYAGLVCSVVDTSSHADCVMIEHPDVLGGQSYASRKKYLTKVAAKPVIKPDDIIKLREDCTAKHGEFIPQGLYIVGHVDGFDDTCTVLTVHGGYGQASLPMAMVHKVGVCSATNG